MLFQDDPFETVRLSSVKVFLRLKVMDNWIKENAKCSKAKVIAPYCWEWKEPKDGTLDEVIIKKNGEIFKKKWNPQDVAMQAKALTSPSSTEQVYCIYTAQGLELDYVAFIWWKDLRWDESTQQWKVSLEDTHDGAFKNAQKRKLDNSEDIVLRVKNTYYVLLSRAKEGLGIWFYDEATKRHVCKVLGIQQDN